MRMMSKLEIPPKSPNKSNRAYVDLYVMTGLSLAVNINP
jgi:hypothetical protein